MPVKGISVYRLPLNCKNSAAVPGSGSRLDLFLSRISVFRVLEYLVVDELASAITTREPPCKALSVLVQTPSYVICYTRVQHRIVAVCKYVQVVLPISHSFTRCRGVPSLRSESSTLLRFAESTRAWCASVSSQRVVKMHIDDCVAAGVSASRRRRRPAHPHSSCGSSCRKRGPSGPGAIS